MPGLRLCSSPRAPTVRGRLATLALAACVLPCASLLAQTDYSGFWEVYGHLENGQWTGPAMVKEMEDTGSRLVVVGDFAVDRTGPTTAAGWNFGDAQSGSYMEWTLGTNIDIVATEYWRGTQMAEGADLIQCRPTTLPSTGSFAVSGTYGGRTVSIDKSPAFAVHSVYADGIMAEIADGRNRLMFMLYPASLLGTDTFTATEMPASAGDIGIGLQWEYYDEGLWEPLQGGNVTITGFAADRITGTLNLSYVNSGSLSGSFDLPYKANGTAPPAQAYEPNDTRYNATPIGVDTELQSHTIHSPTDVDYISFAANAGMTYMVRITSTSKDMFGDDYGLFVTLYDTDGQTQIVSDEWGELSPFTPASSGNYYVSVAFNEPYGFYDIEVLTGMGLAGDAWDTDDDSSSGATTLNETGSVQYHTICQATDVDWYSFTVDSLTATYCFETEADMHPWLELYYDSGTALVLMTSTQWGGLQRNFATDGTGLYYLKVHGPQAWYYIGMKVVEPDSYEPAGDNGSGTANEITVDGTSQSHTVHEFNDTDWIKIVTSGPETYYIETFNHSSLGLRLRVDDGTVTLAETDSKDEGEALLVWHCQSTGTYYIVVEQDWSVGNYEILVRTSPGIAEIVADDPDDGDTVLSDNDTLTVVFDMDTNSPSVSSQSDIDGLLDFGSKTLGTTYSATWSDARTLVVTVEDTAGGTVLIGDTVAILPVGNLKNSNNSSPASTASGTIIGDWGYTFVNTAPVAYDQSVTTEPETPVQITLLFDDPGPGLHYFEIVEPPKYGALSGTDYQLTYTPNAGFTGTDSFTWYVNDGEFDSNLATVTITVESAQPTITMTRPSGGEVWYTGQVQRIRWYATGVASVTILYTYDGVTWTVATDAVGSQDANWGDYPWNVPDTLSTRYVVRIQDHADAEIFDESPQFEVRVMTDADGDGMDDGWEYDNFGDTWRDGAGDEDGDGLTDHDEFMNGTDPTNPDTDQDGLSDGPEVHDYYTDPCNPDSDGDQFPDSYEVDAGTDPNDPQDKPVIETSITVTYPDGGEVFLAGDPVTIYWDVPYPEPPVGISYSTDSGETWTQITTSSWYENAYEWTTPPISSTQCRIKVDAGGDAFDESDDDFAVVNSAIVYEQESIEFNGMAGGGGGILVGVFDVRFLARSGSVTVMLDTSSLPDCVVLDTTGFALAAGEKRRVTATIDAPTLPPETSIRKYVEKAIVATATGAELSEAYLAVRFDVYPSRIITGCVPPGPAQGAGPAGAVAAMCLFVLGLALGRPRERYCKTR